MTLQHGLKFEPCSARQPFLVYQQILSAHVCRNPIFRYLLHIGCQKGAATWRCGLVAASGLSAIGAFGPPPRRVRTMKEILTMDLWFTDVAYGWVDAMVIRDLHREAIPVFLVRMGRHF